jgi:hypothetical protein
MHTEEPARADGFVRGAFAFFDRLFSSLASALEVRRWTRFLGWREIVDWRLHAHSYIVVISLGSISLFLVSDGRCLIVDRAIGAIVDIRIVEILMIRLVRLKAQNCISNCAANRNF